MANRDCWWCRTLTHMTLVPGSGSALRAGRSNIGGGMDMYLKQAAFTCDQCQRMSVGYTVDNQLQRMREDVEGSLDGSGSLTWLPERGSSQDFPDVPEQIAGTATEATLCLSVGAYRAVGALARAVVEATAKDKGIEKGWLDAKIDALHAAGHIRELVKGQAHEIRHFGNAIAHGDFIDPTTREEAEEIIELMTELLAEVYQAPAELARRREAREASKAVKALGGAHAVIE